MNILVSITEKSGLYNSEKNNICGKCIVSVILSSYCTELAMCWSIGPRRPTSFWKVRGGSQVCNKIILNSMSKYCNMLCEVNVL